MLVLVLFVRVSNQIEETAFTRLLDKARAGWV
jgi:hypothetical protein